MKYWTRWLGLSAMAAFLVCGPVWAEVAKESTGVVSETLAKSMYCSVGGFMEGDIGLLIGLILVFLGIWSLVQGAKMMAALPLIVIGSLVTALPSLIESTFTGLGVLLVEAGISKPSKDSDSNSAFAAPSCGDMNTPTEEEMQKLYTNPSTGSFYPSRGTPRAANSSGSPDDRDGL